MNNSLKKQILEFQTNTYLCKLTYEDKKWKLIIGIPKISDTTLLSYKSASFEAGFAEIQNVLFLIFRYGSLPWTSIPYLPAKSLKEEDFIICERRRGSALTLLLVDTCTGKIEAHNRIWLDSNLSNDMAMKCRRLLTSPVDEMSYFQKAAEIQNQYPDSKKMLKFVDPQKRFIMYAI